MATVGAAYEYQVTATDPQDETLTYAIQAGPSGMTIDPNSGLLRWTPAQVGQAPVTVAATDTDGAVATQSYTLTVKGPNHPPTISSQAGTSVTAGLTYHYDVQASDPDGDPLTYQLDSGPQGASIDSFGRLAWPTTAADVGSQSFQITVSDGRGGSVNQSFDVAVTADTEPPRSAWRSARNPADIGSSVTFVVSATDNVGVAGMMLTVGGTPVALDPQGRASLAVNTAGQLAVVATATDAAGNQGTATDSLLVINPVVTGASDGQPARPPQQRCHHRPGLDHGDGQRPQPALLHARGRLGGRHGLPSDRHRHLAGDQRRPGHARPDDDGQRPLHPPAHGHQCRRPHSDYGHEFQRDGQPQVRQFHPVIHRPDGPCLGHPDHCESHLRHAQRERERRTSATAGPSTTATRTCRRASPRRTTRPTVSSTRSSTARGSTSTLPGGQREGFTFEPIEGSAFLTTYFTPNFVPDPGVTDQLTVEGESSNQGDLAGFEDLAGQGGTITLFQQDDGSYADADDIPLQPGGRPLRRQVLRDDQGRDEVPDRRPLRPAGQRHRPQRESLDFSDAGISSSAGPAVTFSRDPQGRITAVTDPMGKQVLYQYDGRGTWSP